MEVQYRRPELQVKNPKTMLNGELSKYKDYLFSILLGIQASDEYRNKVLDQIDKVVAEERKR